MRTIFLADAHLHQPDDHNYQVLLRFIRSLQGTTETLCILGDLFDFRIGLPGLVFPEQEPLLHALEQLHNTGTRLVYLEGNHDFHLGPELASRLGAEIHTGPVTLNLQGRQVYLCHGDLINRADWRYRLLHRALRHPVTVHVGRFVPPAVVHSLRHRLQRTSKGRYSHDQRRWDYTAKIRSFGDFMRGQGCDALVLGHFHQPFIDRDEQFTLVSLGDWITQFSYAEMLDGQFHLLTCPA